MGIKFRIISENDNFVEYLIDSSKYIIHYSDLQQYWSYANVDDEEGVKISLNGNQLIGVMLTASAQGGIIFVWDCEQHKLLHISDGSYTYAAAVLDNCVYGLCVVSNFVTPAHFALSKSAFGTMDAFTEAEIVNCTINCDVDKFDGNLDNIELLNNQGQLLVNISGDEYPVEMK